MGELRGVIVPVTPFQQNCTILFDADTKKGVVVDPGGDVPRILEVLEGAGGRGRRKSGSPTAISTMPAGRWN